MVTKGGRWVQRAHMRLGCIKDTSGWGASRAHQSGVHQGHIRVGCIKGTSGWGASRAHIWVGCIKGTSGWGASWAHQGGGHHDGWLHQVWVWGLGFCLQGGARFIMFTKAQPHTLCAWQLGFRQAAFNPSCYLPPPPPPTNTHSWPPPPEHFHSHNLTVHMPPYLPACPRVLS